MGIKDTACYYYEQLMECGTLYARADAAWNLAQYAIQEQNSEKAYNFLNQYIKDIEIVWERNDTETVRKLRALYNYNIKEKENQQLKIENKQKQLHLFFALGGIFVVLLGFYNYYLYSQKEQAKLIAFVFLNSNGEHPKCCFVNLPKKDGLGKSSILHISLML